MSQRNTITPARFLGVIVVIAALIWVYVTQIDQGDQDQPTDQAQPVVWEVTNDEVNDALATLASADVAQPREVSYDRTGQFGGSWDFDFDTNGCDTRNDILARDLTDVTTEDGCIVLTGTLADPYTGTDIAFQRGVETSGAVQIDHIIPLAWAARQGALDWDATTREGFANDPINLMAVDGPTNGSKSDQGPSEWMPPNTGFHCRYAVSFVDVLATYDLTIPAQDAAALTSTPARMRRLSSPDTMGA